VDRDGLEERLRSLPKEERKKLYSFFSRRLPSTVDPCDAIQETFTRAFRLLDELRDDDGFMGWLFTIAGFVAHEMRRASLRVLKREGALGKDVDVVGREPEGGASAEDRERQERVHAALDELPDEERMAIELNIYGGLSQTEIASALRWSLAKVKNRAKAGHEKLLVLLKDVEL
jgi:RNA polymerase sigma-70 factor, ECF subfamily